LKKQKKNNKVFKNMSIPSFLDSKIKKMDWLDISLVKWSCVAFGVLLVILFPDLLEINAWLVVAVVVILALRPFYRVYLKKD